MCSSVRANRLPGPDEFVLDEADGVDWPTICKCEPIVSVSRDDIIEQRRGLVTATRRSALLRRVLAAHAWSEILAHH